MMVSIYRNADDSYDCTNGGVSSKHTRAFVILPHYPADQKLPDDVAILKLESHARGIARLVPNGEKRWCMFGGNFAHTSDGRFWDAVEALTGQRMYGAVAIHDRIENKD